VADEVVSAPKTAPADSGILRAGRSENQWALIWRQFRKRRLAVASGCVILVLVTVSIFAPMIANDRPIYYLGYNQFAYSSAFRTLNVVMIKSTAGKDSQWSGTEGQVIVGRQIELMSQALSAAALERLRAFESRLAVALDTDMPGRQSAVSELRREFRSEFSVGNVEFVSRSHWPVLAALDWSDALFMMFAILLLTCPIWNYGLRKVLPGRKWQNTGAVGLLGVLVAVPVLGAVIWGLSVPSRIDRAQYKQGRLIDDDRLDSRTHVAYQAVLWPVVPYGLDEDNLSIQELPPVWPPFWPMDSETAAKEAENLGDWDRPHWLGTDSIGRDTLCRMIWGGRVSLSVGIVAVSIYVTIGIVIGSIAGYFRGIIDLLVSRVIEIVICFPSFFLILTIVAFAGPSIFNIMLVIGVTGWTGVARLVRAEFLRLGEQEFVLAGRALGYSSFRIIFRHVLPNALAPVLVSATFGVAGAILTESGLSFLGFGITVPKPSWGGILASGRDAIIRAPWLIYFPGLAIFVTITAYNLVGEALRDAADPRLRGSR